MDELFEVCEREQTLRDLMQEVKNLESIQTDLSFSLKSLRGMARDWRKEIELDKRYSVQIIYKELKKTEAELIKLLDSVVVTVEK